MLPQALGLIASSRRLEVPFTIQRSYDTLTLSMPEALSVVSVVNERLPQSIEARLIAIDLYDQTTRVD